jgi:hypothetical protein
MTLHSLLSHINAASQSPALDLNDSPRKETPIWMTIFLNFEQAIKDRDLVCIKHKLEIKRYQTVFRTIYLRLIDQMQKDNESTKNLSQAEKALVTLLMRLEVIKTCRDDKSFLTNHKSSI